MPDNTLSTLQQIIIKVRRLTRSPSQAQISDDDITDYINTFILYDFPEHLRLFSLRTTFTFYCDPYVDTYATNTINNDPLNNFINTYISIHPPVYIGGYLAVLSQDRTQFYGQYPLTNAVASIGSAGDGVTTAYSGSLTNTGGLPILQNNVTFTSIDSNNNGITLIDVPTVDGQGILVVPNNNVACGTINYITGAYTINFPVAPGNLQPINSQTIPYQPSRPNTMLYYQNQFVLRPVPDQPYRIDMEAYIRPSELLESGDMPQLSQWWQYYAYGAAKKIFEDRMDVDSVALIDPEYKKQEALVLRSTIVQYTNERTSTIYTAQSGLGQNSGNNGNGVF
jgi:hypothetical protein